MTDLVRTDAQRIADGHGRNLLTRPMDEALREMRDRSLQPQVQAAAIQLRAELTPPSTDQIAICVESLQAVYDHDKRDAQAQRVMVRAWCDVLADIPYVVMQAAVREWLRRDTAFMPKPGEFLAACNRILAGQEAIARRAEALAAADLSEVQDEREVSEEDRKAMKAKLQALWKEVRA